MTNATVLPDWVYDLDEAAADCIEHLYCCDPSLSLCGVRLDPAGARGMWDRVTPVCPLCMLEDEVAPRCPRCPQ